jgi:hypothetical protein
MARPKKHSNILPLRLWRGEEDVPISRKLMEMTASLLLKF